MPIVDLDTFLASPFDYIIIGGGTAGLVLAARLSEAQDIRVGVLEAGKSRLDDPLVDSPANVGKALHNAEYDWIYKSTPQVGTADKIHHVPRGKFLGGSSGINYMAYVRPSAQDIDAWSKLGNAGWSWDELAPYYRKSQTLCMNPEPHLADPSGMTNVNYDSHGHDGPTRTAFPPRRNPGEDAFVAAFDKTTGIPRAKDPWNGAPLGMFSHLSTISPEHGYSRSYSASAYLRPNLHRPNLKVLIDAHVRRLILSKDGTVVNGVEFTHSGAAHEVSASLATILAAGSVGSPQILELSGVGDPDILSKAGVDCIVPLKAVGNRLQDHPLTAVSYSMQPHKDDEGFYGFSVLAFVPYTKLVSPDEVERTVELISNGTSQLTATERQLLIERLRDENAPLVQYNVMPVGIDIEHGSGNAGTLVSFPGPGANPIFAMLVSLTTPASRGSTHITSSDPEAMPRIDIGLLRDLVDAQLLAAGVRLADKVFSSPALAGLIDTRISPKPETDLGDDQQARQHLSNCTSTFYHLLGSCSMGYVVNERLQVNGIKGLYVVDASVIPVQISGNILSTVYAVAEKAADMIKEDHTSH